MLLNQCDSTLSCNPPTPKSNYLIILLLLSLAVFWDELLIQLWPAFIHSKESFKVLSDVCNYSLKAVSCDRTTPPLWLEVSPSVLIFLLSFSQAELCFLMNQQKFVCLLFFVLGSLFFTTISKSVSMVSLILLRWKNLSLIITALHTFLLFITYSVISLPFRFLIIH